MEALAVIAALGVGMIFGMYIAERKRRSDRPRDKQATYRDEHDPYWQRDEK